MDKPDNCFLLAKCRSSTGVYQNFASKNQLAGFYKSRRTLAENGLRLVYLVRISRNKKENQNFSQIQVLCKKRNTSLQSNQGLLRVTKTEYFERKILMHQSESFLIARIRF